MDAGNPGLSYLWSDASSNQTLTVFISGAYNVLVTDTITGCNSADAINLTINPAPIVNLGADSTQCGGSITMDAGAGATSYSWTGGTTLQTLTVSASGTYNVTVSNSFGCTATDGVVITINAIPSVSFTIPPSPMCLQASPATMVGTPSGGTFLGTGVSGTTFDPAIAGLGVHSITYGYTDVNSCSNSVSQNVTVQDCAGVEEHTFSQDVNVFPNPTSGLFSISISNANFTELNIMITDIQGKVVFNELDKNITADFTKQINLDNLAKGIYYIKLSTGAEMKISKLIIQ